MATSKKNVRVEELAPYKVYVTNNYDKFKILEGNREVGAIGFIKKNIQKYGYLWMPILVNEKFEVIEGQHRLEACKELGVPIHYIIQQGLGREHCIALNVGRRNWGTADYVHSYSLDNVDYSYFEILKRKHPQFGPSTIYTAYNNSNTNSVAKSIRNGTLRCTEQDFVTADRVLSWLDGFADDIKAQKISGSKMYLYRAMIFAYNSPKTVKSALTQRIHANIHLIGHSVASFEDGIMKIEDIYNYRVPAENRVDLLSEYRNSVRKAKNKDA